MRRLWGLLLTAGALVPGIAAAQEGEEAGRNRMRGMQVRTPRMEGEQPRPERPAWQQSEARRPGGPSGDRGWQGRPDTPQQRADAPPPGPAPSGRGSSREFGQNGLVPRGTGNGRGGEWWRGGDRFGSRPGAATPEPVRPGAVRPGAITPGASYPGQGSAQADPRRPDWRNNDRRGTRTPDRWWQGSRDWPHSAWGRPSAGWQRDRADWIDGFRGQRDFEDRAAWNRGWRDDDRFDWSRQRSLNRGRYHLPRYYAPPGWDAGYRRFAVGGMLSDMLFAQDYWIDEPDVYRLPPVYDPYRWVRYYNDALLVDLRYGQVADVVYDIFW